jgi:protein KTI12
LNDTALAEKTGGYTPEVFENLVFRYEEPNGLARWDAPLFTVPHDDLELPFEAIWDTLIGNDGKRKVVKPNQATVIKASAGGDYLYELDKATNEVLAAVMSWIKEHDGEGGGDVGIEGVERSVELPVGGVAPAKLQRLRRAFIALNRTHEASKERVKGLFVDYLNDAFEAG